MPILLCFIYVSFVLSVCLIIPLCVKRGAKLTLFFDICKDFEEKM